jgi:hypothetical protein
MREIVRFEADLGQNMRHLAQEIKHFTIRFRYLNPKTMERNDGIVDEAPVPEGRGWGLRLDH